MRRLKWIGLLTAALLLTGLILLPVAGASSGYLNQIPAGYDKSCSLCHSSIPQLNSFGQQFAAAGHKFPAKSDNSSTSGSTAPKTSTPSNTSTAPSTIEKTAKVIKGQESADVKVMVVKNRSLIQVRDLVELMGGSADWSKASQTVAIKAAGSTLIFTINKATAKVNDKEVTLDAPPIIKDGRTMVPLRFIVEKLGGKVNYDAQKGITVTISTTPPVSDIEPGDDEVADKWPKGEPAKGYVGPEVCAACHQNTYNAWKGSRHARMLQRADDPTAAIFGDFGTNTFFAKDDVLFAVGTGLMGTQRYVGEIDGLLKFLPAQWNIETRTWTAYNSSAYSCGTCHTTGFNPGTDAASNIDDGWVSEGISCEACHGPGEEHVRTGDTSKLKISNSSEEMCGSCHGGDRQVGQMQDTGHNTFFAYNMENNPTYGDNCLKCHSATAFRAKVKPTVEDFRTGALKDDRNGITCMVCHSPHKNINEKQLRKDITTTCTQCHTNQGTPVAGKAPHHPQKEMFEGTAVDLTVPNPKQITCADCHMANGNHKWQVGTPTITLLSHGNPIEVDTCIGCHNDMTSERIAAAQEDIMGKVETLNAGFEGAKADIAAAKTAGKDVAAAQALYDANYTNLHLIEADKSEGIHNYALAEAIVAKAETDLAAIPDLLK